uniref:MADF domain-containing protein n=1 Tax=Sinocyclocheilus anshuiensis TaxID=1608454 RepID=A0A671M358_9TELE
KMEERLIIAVAGFPVIYDVSLSVYRDVKIKNVAWTKVSEVVGVSADECRKRWKSLRDTYRKERRKEAERKRSGAGVNSVRPWRYSGVMGFLNPFLEDRITAGSSSQTSAPQEDSDSLFFKSLLEDFRTLSLRTRQDLKFQMHKLVYEAKCFDAGHTDHWEESIGGQLTSL